MIRAGDSVVNPVTGERLVFHRTSEETGGEYCRFEVYIEPGGAVAAAHVHPFQTGLAMGAPVGRMLRYQPTYEATPREIGPSEAGRGELALA